MSSFANVPSCAEQRINVFFIRPWLVIMTQVNGGKILDCLMRSASSRLHQAQAWRMIGDLLSVRKSSLQAPVERQELWR